jgi:CRP/FNR family cyclic AMP-dependent transcriptional regulator
METVDLPAVGFLVADLGRPRSLAPGEILFLEGDHSASVYAVVEGRIRLFVSLPSGQELLLGMKVPGDEFGELSAIDGRPRSASAMATDRSVVAELPSDRFLRAISDRPEYWLTVCQSLSAQLRRANDRLIARNSSSATVRTGRMLVELASLMMRHGGGGDVFELPMTQSDLAEWIGATRESTARALCCAPSDLAGTDGLTERPAYWAVYSRPISPSAAALRIDSLSPAIS